MCDQPFTLEHATTAKRAEVANYERILAKSYGRWYDSGARHLQVLKNELAALEELSARLGRPLHPPE